MVAARRPRAYVCGHIHSAKGVVRGSGATSGTLFVNGASVLGDHTAKAGAGASYVINGAPLVVAI